jgi:hypothetical protein
MIFSEDSSEKGKKCEVVIKGETIACTVICSFERIKDGKTISKKYRLESKDKTIHDNISASEIIFKK